MVRAGALSHVGLAIFNVPNFPTQWVLVLCNNELFQGHVLCSTVGMNVDGWQEFWVECDWSPISFNRAATFVGVVHVAVLSVSMERVHSEFLAKGTLSKTDDNPAYTDRYVLRALKRIGEKRFGDDSILTKEEQLSKVVREKIPLLLQNQSPPSTHTYPVAFLPQSGISGVRVGKSSRWH
jgi:hypothetical protein